MELGEKTYVGNLSAGGLVELICTNVGKGSTLISLRSFCNVSIKFARVTSERVARKAYVHRCKCIKTSTIYQVREGMVYIH